MCKYTSAVEQPAAKERIEIAEKVSGSDKLTRQIVDLLIDKVRVSPDKRVEINWKVADFYNDANSTQNSHSMITADT